MTRAAGLVSYICMSTAAVLRLCSGGGLCVFWTKSSLQSSAGSTTSCVALTATKERALAPCCNKREGSVPEHSWQLMGSCCSGHRRTDMQTGSIQREKNQEQEAQAGRLTDRQYIDISKVSLPRLLLVLYSTQPCHYHHPRHMLSSNGIPWICWWGYPGRQRSARVVCQGATHQWQKGPCPHEQ